MNIYRYVIDHDMGFSPNPFYGVCTLANCKPVIRRVAKIGDFVLGFGSANSSVAEKLIYWMKIAETMSFDSYWADPRFQLKKPVVNGSHLKFHGDNIYHTDSRGDVAQAWSFHSLPDGRPNPKNIKRDTGSTSRLLVGFEFGYYGRAALSVPGEFSAVTAKGRGHRTKLTGCSSEDVVDWLLHSTERGFCGEPSGWSRIPKNGHPATHQTAIKDIAPPSPVRRGQKSAFASPLWKCPYTDPHFTPRMIEILN